MQVGYMIKDNEQRFKDAYKVDLGRPAFETSLCVEHTSVETLSHVHVALT